MSARDILQAAAGLGADKLYVDDVFRVFLSTGNGSSRTVTGPDMTEGGLSITKSRSAATGWRFVDTERGAGSALESNSTSAALSESGGVTAFTSTGTTIGSDSDYNTNGATYVDFLFRKAPKFFDVVTYTGNGANGRQISHSLDAEPGLIIIKNYGSGIANWTVWHRSLTSGYYLLLNSTAAQANTNAHFGAVTSTYFTVNNPGGTDTPNGNTDTCVAYLFAHDAGGFGDDGTENVISCGSYTGNGSTTGPVVTLGYEPQWVLIKQTNTSRNWLLHDNMRSMSLTDAAYLIPNLSDAEATSTASVVAATATGFQIRTDSTWWNQSGGTYIYIAIRRGPMKTPESGTEVFDVGTRSGSGSVAKTNSDILTDLAVIKRYTNASEYWAWTPRLNGNLTLQSNSTDANLTGAMATNPWDTMTGAFCAASNGATNTSTLVDYSFRRAPGFFDVVCYTGNGSTQNINHNLGVVPELMIVKRRNSTGAWGVYSAPTGNSALLQLESTGALQTGAPQWNSTTPTSTVFSLGSSSTANASGSTYVAYLFASCPGVSKIGSYTGTGTGTTLQINCGFTAGARFILIKRTDSTGDWYVWDSARGIVSGNDPYLLLNSTTTEVTSTDYIDPYAAGFEISSSAPAAINASGGSFIFLAVA